MLNDGFVALFTISLGVKEFGRYYNSIVFFISSHELLSDYL